MCELSNMGPKKDENLKIKENHATAKAKETRLKEWLQEQAERSEKKMVEQGESSKIENRITNISTFNTADKLDLNKVNINHYFVALSQYYKMRLQEERRKDTLGNPGNPISGLTQHPFCYFF